MGGQNKEVLDAEYLNFMMELGEVSIGVEAIFRCGDVSIWKKKMKEGEGEKKKKSKKQKLKRKKVK